MQSYRSLFIFCFFVSSFSFAVKEDRKDITLYQGEDFWETEHSSQDIQELAKKGDQSNLADVEELAKDDDLGQKQKKSFRLEFGDSVFDISNRLRVDGFYGVNLNLLNNKNNDRDPQLDKIAFPGRHTFDAWFLYTYGSKSRGYDVVKFRSGLRNRSIWGDETSILPTSTNGIKHVDANGGEHFHTLSRHVIWFREIWLEMVLNDIFGCESKNRHTLTMGLFPFSVGRGIALGEAFDVDPDFLGYFGVSAIDQYAPAFKLSGELIGPDTLRYDLYAEIADNTSDNFTQINELVKGQQFDKPGTRGRVFTPQRGFGVFDYILAARLQWRPFDKPGSKVHLEPYAVYSVDKEQKIEFTGDAMLKLGTFGLAGEFEYGNFEAGFDTAFNVGKQTVFGWDRNILKEAANKSNGIDTFVYSKVTAKQEIINCDKEVKTIELKQVPKTEEPKDNSTTKIVDDSLRGRRFNGKEIGKTKIDCIETTLFNAKDRFTNPYENKLRGAMFVFDAAYNFPCSIKAAVTAGFATGDDDPNKDIQSIGESDVNTTFKGFIGEQELYSGKRVRSLLVMSGPSVRIPRLVSIPALDTIDGKPVSVTHFTNLILTGAGMEFKPKLGNLPLVLKPNVLGFWAWHTPRPVKLRGMVEGEKDPGGTDLVVLKRRAGNFLGTELNFTLEAELLKDLTYIFNIAGFIPGQFFKDLTGTPLSKDELAFIKSQSPRNQGAPVKRVPLLGHDPAYYVQMTMEYKF